MIEYASVKEAADYISSKISENPTLGIVLGTGFASAVSDMKIEVQIPYGDVPNMRESTNPVHPGKFVVGKICGKQVICMQGRIHMYEGYAADEVAFPVFVMKLLGVKTLVVTNASGAINTEFGVGDFVVIKDHINFMGRNPLLLSIDPRLGTPCPDMTYAYSPALRKKVEDAAASRGEHFSEGVYIGVMGPSFETPAEIRMFRTWGADLVGMSTVPEVIAAASCGIELFGISLVTNMAAGILDQKISAEDINNIKADIPERLGRVIASIAE